MHVAGIYRAEPLLTVVDHVVVFLTLH